MSRTITDHSQNGEFFELLKLMIADAAPTRIVVDVGANGRERSNSYDLLRLFGWRGLLVEPNPALKKQIDEGFAGLDYALASCAVSDFEGEAEFFLGVHAGISSLSQKATEVWGPVSGSIRVPVRRLHSVLDEHAIPKDFEVLSLDVESHDARVLNDLHKSSAYRPRWVIIEGSHDFTVTDPRRIGVSDAVMADYAMVGATRVNLILKRRS